MEGPLNLTSQRHVRLAWHRFQLLYTLRPFIKYQQAPCIPLIASATKLQEIALPSPSQNQSAPCPWHFFPQRQAPFIATIFQRGIADWLYLSISWKEPVLDNLFIISSRSLYISSIWETTVHSLYLKALSAFLAVITLNKHKLTPCTSSRSPL